MVLQKFMVDILLQLLPICLFHNLKKVLACHCNLTNYLYCCILQYLFHQFRGVYKLWYLLHLNTQVLGKKELHPNRCSKNHNDILVTIFHYKVLLETFCPSIVLYILYKGFLKIEYLISRYFLQLIFRYRHLFGHLIFNPQIVP